MNQSADSEPVRILLSKAASDHLTATGERAFIVIHKVMRGVEEPDTIGRWALTLHPCSVETSNAARRVALGESKERKPKPSKP